MHIGKLKSFWRAIFALLISLRHKTHGEFQLHSGVIVKALALHPTESIYPISFDFELPSYISQPRFFTELDETAHLDEFSNITLAISETDTVLETLVKFYWDTERAQMSFRTKRGLEFIGDFFSWCCELSTHRELFPAGNAARLNLKKLNIEISNAFRSVAFNNEQLQNYTVSVKSVLLSLTQRVNNIAHALTDSHDKFLLQKMITLFKRTLSQEYKMINILNANTAHEIVTACRNDKLSPLLVSPENLKKALIELRNNIYIKGFNLAIPINETTHYYSNSLVQCIRQNELLTVQVKIPLISRAVTWSLFTLNPIAFAHQDQTCNINILAEVAVGIPADGSPHLFFNLERRPTDTLAMISDTPLSTAQANCVRALISPRVTLENLKSFCTFQCTQKNDLAVQRTGHRDFILTFPKNLNLHCDNKTHFVTNATKGAVLINVPCSCSLRSNTETIIRTVYPCLNENQNTTVKHLIPQQWSKLPNSIYISQLASFPNLTAILDPVWADGIPNVTLISPEITEQDWDIFPRILAYSSIIHYITLGVVGFIIIRNPRLLIGIQDTDRSINIGMNDIGKPRKRKRNKAAPPTDDADAQT
jgi:hypothetical protein